jgi:1,5-anhydro-D-fructose reductase (1,5-anhydro-D-mannitol-forming)
MMSGIRWGLVGATFIARDWMIPAFRKNGDTVLSVLSSSSERAREFASANGIPTGTTSLDELLDSDVDAVYISTTNELHVPQALAAVRAGKHVLCEKPLAIEYDGAKQMVEEARRAGLVFATNHHLRNSGTHRAMRQTIAAGKIGRPLFAKVAHARYLPAFLQGWRLTNPEKGAGVILDITTHDVDSLRFLLGENPKSILCMTQTGTLAKGDIEDGAMSLIEFESGLVAQTHDAFTTKYASTGMEIHGTEGSLFGKDCMTQDPIGEVVLRSDAGEEALTIDRGNLYEYGLKAFGEAVSGSGVPAASGVDGLWSLATGLAAVESGRTGRRVAVRV